MGISTFAFWKDATHNGQCKDQCGRLWPIRPCWLNQDKDSSDVFSIYCWSSGHGQQQHGPLTPWSETSVELSPSCRKLTSSQKKKRSRLITKL